MRLNDVRRMAIRKQLRVRFRLANGGECQINERGIAEALDWKGLPDLQLERELENASAFIVTAAGRSGETSATPETWSRRQFEEMMTAGATGAGAGEAEHDE